ncbi:MAG: ROK family protein [Anaerolineales bacterium]
MTLFGGIEAGGTKFICAVGRGPDDIAAEAHIQTTTPAETLEKAIQFFKEQDRPVEAIGIGSFGPLDVNINSPGYGHITATTKPGWSNTDILGQIQSNLDVPCGFDTDVNAAALGEHRWGAAQGLDTFLYLTIGTGIGGGAIVDGKRLHGMMHPEMGHMVIPHDRELDPFDGNCPFHRDCLEGLASGPAIKARWGESGESLPADHPAWTLEAHYLALGLVNLICTLSPQRIILGGGVMQQTQLFAMVRSEVRDLLKGYIQAPEILENIDTYIVPPALGGKSGVLGAIALAEEAYQSTR